jgi:Ni,Fe-hydrogenase III small subunit/Pyruvate/2-oxoacid:ferredoxin oxidoreductase delta subunit
MVTTRPYPLGKALLPGTAARTPVHDPTICQGSAECGKVCPTGAITVEGMGKGARFHLDYGSCIFCRRCVDVCPTGALTAVPDFELSVLTREDLVIDHAAGSPAPVRGPGLAGEVQAQIGGLFGGSLAVREVDAGSCGGCELEVHSLTWPAYDLERLGIHVVASPRHADALLVTGGVTANMRLALEKTFRATASPKFVMAVGACGISGGPFCGSPEVRGGVASTLPVQVYVPGCPPRPEALLYGFWLALGKVEQRLRKGELPK